MEAIRRPGLIPPMAPLETGARPGPHAIRLRRDTNMAARFKVSVLALAQCGALILILAALANTANVAISEACCWRAAGHLDKLSTVVAARLEIRLRVGVLRCTRRW